MLRDLTSLPPAAPISRVALAWGLASTLTLFVPYGLAQEPKPAPKPITADRGPIGKLLEKWHAEGTAAGNLGDLYDNRDREHSELSRSAYPQLEKWQYPKEELDRRADWALFGGLRPGIVFGNSSTSAGAYQGGSNPRRAYTHPQGLAVLYRQYRGNNLYIYPEHRDHDPGHNGQDDGYGDLYPTNTPYLLISQGSSGSDQPFMRAVPFTLAAFRPEVKQKLAENGLLMPTIQMLLRTASKRLTNPAEYLTGKAHPTVFDGSWVDAQKMVELAHEITPEDLPPLALLSVKKEEAPLQGRDFFEPGATEVHSDTPAVIARIFRGYAHTRRMVVSAAASLDVNQRPLKFHWVLLRGDPARVKITPNADGTEAELEVAWHERRPIEPGSPIESNRIDIGVFAHNGKYYSPPAFITWLCLDQEDRTYDAAGRIVDIGYKAGDTELKVQDWPALFALLQADAAGWPAELGRQQFSPAELTALGEAAVAFAPLNAALQAAQATQKEAEGQLALDRKELQGAQAKVKAAEEAAKATPTDDARAAQQQAELAQSIAESAVKEREVSAKADARVSKAALEALQAMLREKRAGPANQSVEERVNSALARLADDPAFYLARQTEFAAWLATPAGMPRQGALANARKRLIELGMFTEADGKSELRLARPGDQPVAERLTRYERSMLRRFHAELLAGVLLHNVVRSEFRANYVPPEIAEPPAWRDVYQHDSQGRMVGWTRYGAGEPRDYTADGHLVVSRDPPGRPLTARSVVYESEQPKQRINWPHWRPTLERTGDELHHYVYEGEQDRRGKIERTEKSPPKAE